MAVAKLIAVMHHEPKSIAVAAILSECQHLSESWRATFAQRVKRGTPPGQSARLEGEP